MIFSKSKATPRKIPKFPDVSCIVVTCVNQGCKKFHNRLRNCPSHAPTVNRSRDYIFRLALMAADGISPSIIPTEFCLHLVHHQSRSLVPSIKGVSETNCTEALLATNIIGTFSNQRFLQEEFCYSLPKIVFIESRLILFSKALLISEYPSSKVILN